MPKTRKLVGKNRPNPYCTEDRPEDPRDSVDQSDPHSHDLLDGNHYAGQLDANEEAYFSKLQSLLKSDPPQELISQAWLEIKDKAVKCCCSPIASRAIEKLLESSSSEHILEFATWLNGSYCMLARHPFGSRTLQALLKHLYHLKRSEDENPEHLYDLDFIITARTAIDYIGTEILEDVDSLAHDRNGTHVLRYFLRVLLHHDLESNELPQFCNNPTELLLKIYGRFANAPLAVIRQLALDASGSPILQLLISSMESNTSECKIISKLLPSSLKDTAFCTTLTRDAVGSHLMQIIVKIIPKPELEKFFSQFFENRCHRLSMHPTANYTLKTIILRDDCPETQKTIIKELSPYIKDLVQSSQRDLLPLVGLKACELNDSDLQQEIGLKVIDLCKQEDIDKHNFKNLIMNLFTLQPGEFQKHTESLKLNQAFVLLEALYNTRYKQAKLLEIISKTSDEGFLAFCLNKSFTFFIQRILNEPTLTLAQRTCLIRKFKSSFHLLAKDSNGTFVLDACWNCAGSNSTLVNLIANTLSLHIDELRNDFFGNKVIKFRQIELYNRDPRKWIKKYFNSKS